MITILLAIGIVVAFIAGCAYTERHRPEPLDPDRPGLLDVADGPRCPYETVCPSDPHGVLEPCSLAAGHDGPHQHPHTAHPLDPAEFYPCGVGVRRSTPVPDESPCCLSLSHDGPHLPALAIPPGATYQVHP